MKSLSYAVFGVLALAVAAYDLSTGETIVKNAHRVSRSYEPATRVVTRDAAPVDFYGEVALLAGGGIYLLYTALRGRS